MALGEYRRAEEFEFVVLQRPDLGLLDMQLLRDLQHADLLGTPRLGKPLAADGAFCSGIRRFNVRFFFLVGHGFGGARVLAGLTNTLGLDRVREIPQ
jgi:hypothetical protein